MQWHLPTSSPAGTGVESEGFAVIHEHAGRAVDANVIAQGAATSPTYQAELLQTPAGPCTPATLATDAQGDGSIYLSVPIGPVTNGAFAFVYTSPCSGSCVFDLAITPNVVFSLH